MVYMDIKNSFIKQTSGTMINGKPHFGLKFIKKKIYEDIYTLDKE